MAIDRTLAVNVYVIGQQFKWQDSSGVAPPSAMLTVFDWNRIPQEL